MEVGQRLIITYHILSSVEPDAKTFFELAKVLT